VESVEFPLLTLALGGAAALAFLVGSERMRAVEQRLGLSAIATSGLPFVLLGAALGQDGFGLLRGEVLQGLRPVFDFGLGWLGFVFGARVDFHRLDQMPASFSNLVATLTATPMALTAAAALPLMVALGSTPDEGLLRTVAVLAACAGASAPTMRGVPERARPLVAELARYGHLLALTGLGILSVLYRPAGPLGTEGLVTSAWLLLMLGLGALLGALSFALIRAAHSEAEEFALLAGVVALAAGVASALGLSVPVVGAIAGATLINLPIRDRDGLVETLDAISRPLFLLFLVIVGAGWTPAAAGGWAAAGVYAATRLAGIAAGARLASRLEPSVLSSPRGLLAAFTPQSPLAVVIMVAATTSWVGPRPDSLGWALTAVILGSIAVDLMSRPLLWLTAPAPAGGRR